jgi:hypothetical protein
MNIYIDINGVLLTKDLRQALYLEKFLTKILQNNTVYWLTTHCKGDSTMTLQYLASYVDTSCLELCKKILPTNWITWKTEAIDMTKDFLWFDDSLMETEKQALQQAGKFSSWICIDLMNNPNQLNNAYDTRAI